MLRPVGARRVHVGGVTMPETYKGATQTPLAEAWTPNTPGVSPYIGGEIVEVVFDIADDADADREAHLAAAMARD
jgi:hypothetical protein